MTIKSYNSISAIPQDLIENWNHLDVSIEQKPIWLSTCEKVLRHYSPYYCLFFENGELGGVIVSSLVKALDCIDFVSDPEAIEQIKKARLGDNGYFRFDVLFVGIPMSTHNGILSNSLGYEELLYLFRNHVREHIKMDAIFVTNLEDDKYHINDLARIPYIPDTKLELNFNSFDDYLMSLHRKKRWDLKDKRKTFLAAGCQTKIVRNSDVADYPTLFRLYCQTANRADSNVNYILYNEDDKFASLRELDDRYKWIFAIKNHVIIGFSLIVEDGRTLIFKHVGMDYELTPGTFTYFNLYYDAINYAIDNGFSEMKCGTTTYDVKKRLGCAIIQRSAYMDVVSDTIELKELLRMSFSS